MLLEVGSSLQGVTIKCLHGYHPCCGKSIESRNSYFWKIPRLKFVPLLAHNFLSDSGTNLALNQATQQSSNYQRNYGQSSKAVDGNTYGNWNHNEKIRGSVTHTSGYDINPWWKLTLAKRSFVYHIEVRTGPSKKKHIKTLNSKSTFLSYF